MWTFLWTEVRINFDINIGWAALESDFHLAFGTEKLNFPQIKQQQNKSPTSLLPLPSNTPDLIVSVH
jgi:hypothetical protein